jgi:hypothetical protein
MISINTHSTITSSQVLQKLARRLTANSKHSNSDKKSKAKLLRASWIAKRIAGVQAKLQKDENPRLKQTTKRKHQKSKCKVKGSNPSQGRAEWLRSTRTTTMANKCDCTSCFPSQLFASPQQTHNCLLEPPEFQNLTFDFVENEGLAFVYEINKIMRCDVQDVIVCWKSF